MKKVNGKIILCMFIVLFVVVQSLTYPVLAVSSNKYNRVIGDPYYTNPSIGSKQHRFIIITTDPVWTKYKYVSKQPKKGTYLQKGDGLFYGEKGGDSTSISISLGYAGISVAMSVPVGVINDDYGTFKRANKKGYYKLKVKKQIIPRVALIQYRNREIGGKWSKWTKPKVYMKTYDVNRVVPVLQKIK